MRCTLEFKRHAAFAREINGDFKEELGQDESNDVWCHQVLFDTTLSII